MKHHLQYVLAVFAILLSMSAPALQAWAEPITKASPEQLGRWLRQYPAADANADGVLTVEEAEAYRRRALGGRSAAGSTQVPRFPHEFTVFTVSDGVQIALAVGYPKDFDPADASRKWPVIFRTSGYTAATVPMNPGDFADRYVTVSASIRGTGASGGQLSPWRPRGDRTVDCQAVLVQRPRGDHRPFMARTDGLPDRHDCPTVASRGVCVGADR